MKVWWVNKNDLKDAPDSWSDVGVVAYVEEEKQRIDLNERVIDLQRQIAEMKNNYEDNRAVEKGVIDDEE